MKAGAEFNPTLVSNGNGDSILDVGETWTYTATVIPPKTVVAVNVGGGVDGTEIGTIVTKVLPNGDYRIEIIYDDSLNDNRYGAGSDAFGNAGQSKACAFSN